MCVFLEYAPEFMNATINCDMISIYFDIGQTIWQIALHQLRVHNDVDAICLFRFASASFADLSFHRFTEFGLCIDWGKGTRGGKKNDPSDWFPFQVGIKWQGCSAH